MPGGNPKLKNESGFTYEAGLSFSVGRITPILYLVQRLGSTSILMIGLFGYQPLKAFIHRIILKGTCLWRRDSS